MIEKYSQIDIFKPKKFAKLIMQGDDILLENLQTYTDFILQQYGINERYEVVFAKLKNGVLAKCDIDSKQIQLSESEFLKYKENKDILYSFNIPLAIYHEITHAYQYKEFSSVLTNVNEYNEYEHTINPMFHSELYYLQKTEREAYSTQIEESKILQNYFKENNFIEDKDYFLLENIVTLLENQFNQGFKENINTLVENRQLNKKDIKDIAPETFEQNIKVYNKVKEILYRELLFSRERNELIRNESSFITDKINIPKEQNNLEKDYEIDYQYKIEKVKWSISIKSTTMLCGFVLEDNLCKIHTLQKLDGRFSNEKAVKEMLVFTKAFLETYNQKIDKIQISDYADWGYDYPVTYKNTKSMIDENTKGFLKKYLILNPSLIKNQDIIKTNIKNSFIDSIDKNLSLDDKINLYTTNNKTNDSIEITR